MYVRKLNPMRTTKYVYIFHTATLITFNLIDRYEIIYHKVRSQQYMCILNYIGILALIVENFNDQTHFIE